MYTTSSADIELLQSMIAMLSGMWVFCLIIGILGIVIMWKVFAKANKPGWASLIPIYNTVVLFQIAGMNPWLILTMIVPIVNIVVMFMVYINMDKKFGKGTGFGIGLAVLNIIFMAILAFGDAEYQGE